MKEKDGEGYMIWSTIRWHSICISYQLEKSYVTMIKVINQVKCPSEASEKSQAELSDS